MTENERIWCNRVGFRKPKNSEAKTNKSPEAKKSKRESLDFVSLAFSVVVGLVGWMLNFSKG